MTSSRFHRQIIVPEIGEKGQEILSKTHFAIVGCGGLGSNSANFLTRLGIQQLTLIDYDKVDITNLHRTALYTENDIGSQKTIALSYHLKQINPSLQINFQNTKLTGINAEELLNSCEIILDGSDNLSTRYIINEVAVKHKLPWVYSGVHSTTGMIFAVLPNESPCLSCLSNTFPQPHLTEIPVLGTLPSTIATLQITEAIKLLFKKPTAGFLIFNIWTHKLDQLSFKKNSDCPICVHHQFTTISR
jgi:adenylyltransferase/sulfurtransferase